MGSFSQDQEDRLFKPLKIGAITLQHRIALAPLTRCRATLSHTHNVWLAKEYYAQRGCEPGTLLITEATFISKKAGGYSNIPGVWSEEQCRAWKAITAGVHKKKSFIFCQLWALGRAARPRVLDEEDHQPYVAPSTTRMPGRPETPLPRPLTVPEIKEYVQDYAQAAKNAVFLSDFDGVEVHAANGYLIDQFTQDMTNLRDDEYGGDIPRRARFLLEVMTAVCEAVGEEKVGIRLSPWNNFQGMCMTDPIPQFQYIIEQLKIAFPRLGYIHLVEPDPGTGRESESDFLRKLWAPRPLLSCNGHEAATARQAALRSENEVVVFGRHFIPNPDLVKRIRKGLPLRPYNHDSFYSTESPVGYIDYATVQETFIGKIWAFSIAIGLPLILAWVERGSPS